MKKYEILIEQTPFEDKVVECCLNGKIITILRGQKVQVEKQVYDLLKNAKII